MEFFKKRKKVSYLLKLLTENLEKFCYNQTVEDFEQWIKFRVGTCIEESDEFDQEITVDLF